MIALQTPRLLLRRWRPDDAAGVAELMADPEVCRFFFRTRDRAASDIWLAKVEAHWERHGYGLWAVALRGEADFIGFVGLAEVGPEMPFAPAVEVAWTLAKPWWGRGLAPEAARAAVADGFYRGGLQEIVALTAAQNTPSQRVMEKLGMRRDPGEDFMHPNAPEGHGLAHHVLYRVRNEGWLD